MSVSKKELTKIYNKDYYTKNKEVIIKKGCQVLNCEACGRKISFNGYNRHLNTKLCINTQDKNKRIKERLQVRGLGIVKDETETESLE